MKELLTRLYLGSPTVQKLLLQERERCALIAEAVGKPYFKPVGKWIRPEWAEEIAARIRSGE